MRSAVYVSVFMSIWATTAGAADKPLIGPAPAWVKPVVPPAPAAGSEEAPVQFLLMDQQVVLEPGKRTVFTEVALKIQTPQGLAAGNISLPWRPDTEVPTIHKLRIRRGAQIIDVLASGQTFTVLRREQNLESAMLDGVLTATIQPEGLQVGDVLEFSTSVSSSDPVMKGHVEQTAGAWNGIDVKRAHLRVQWPTSLSVRLRQASALPVLKPVTIGDTTAVELTLNDIQPLASPKGAPARYRLGRLVEVTDLASWADLAALIHPLFDKTSVLPAKGPLRAELDRIQAASTDPKARAQAALALVQDRIRYVALSMGEGGYVPSDPETTWARRFGDCKAKTVLLVALLRELGVEAEPVLVSSTFGDGLDARLPMVGLFDHVLVRAVIGARTYWLDGTRSGDAALDRLETPAFGWGLPLRAQGATLVRMIPAPLAEPASETSIRIDASAGLLAPAATHVEIVLRGDAATATNTVISSLAGEARTRALREFWKEQFDFIEVKASTASFEPKTGEERLVMDGIAKMDWSDGWYRTDGTDIGYKADFSRDPGSDRDAPFAVAHPSYTRIVETIILPPQFARAKAVVDADVDRTIAGVAYKRRAAMEGATFRIEKTERSMQAEFPASEAAGAQRALRELSEKVVSIKKPSDYSPTDADLKAELASTPASSAEFVRRGNMLLDRRDFDGAISDFDHALALDPKNALALADRGMARVWKGEDAAAATDLDAAAALEPRNVVVFRARGLMLQKRGANKEAVAPFTNALEIEPQSTFTLSHRAYAYADADDDDAALKDAESALKLSPATTELYELRAEIFVKRGARDRAEAEAQQAIAANPQLSTAYEVSGRIYLLLDRPSDALKAFDRAIQIAPRASTYAQRSRARPISDSSGRRADLAMAAKLDPKGQDVLSARALLETDEGNYKEAVGTWSQLVALSPKDGQVLLQRARARQLAGDLENALADATAALRLKPTFTDAYMLRANILRIQGKNAEVLREAATMQAASPNEAYAQVAAANFYSALHRDVDAMRAYERALALKPEAYIYLNRALHRPWSDLQGRRADVEAALKLNATLAEALVLKAKLLSESGDAKAAIAAYDVALKLEPEAPNLLAGRGVAYVRSGNTILAEADFANARAKASRPAVLNALCWLKATEGVALESALADCDAALKLAPDAASILDSRGLVLLRLGRIDDAIAMYDRALARSPRLAGALFGRALAWSHKGEKSRSEVDLKAAMQADPGVREDFLSYGVKLD